MGRANLPRIRKQELINAGKIIGTNNIFFLDQKDAHYGLDEKEPLDTTWNIPWVSIRLREIMTNTRYDFVFCLLHKYSSARPGFFEYSNSRLRNPGCFV